MRLLAVERDAPIGPSMAVSVTAPFVGPAPGTLLLLIALLGCGGAPRPGPWHEEPGLRWRVLPPAGTAGPGFTSLGRHAGVDRVNGISDSVSTGTPDGRHGAGVAIADVDADGRPDLYIATTDGPNVLYRNRGGWRFENVTERAGVALADRRSTGVAFADVDADGDPDLLVHAMGGRDALLLNDGRGRFHDATLESGLAPDPLGSTTSAFADVDGDGDLDLYVASYQTRAEMDRLYLNDGTGRFRRVAMAGTGRFRDETGRPLARAPGGLSLAARFVDVNADRAPDLYVANDLDHPDLLWLNDGAGNFRLIGSGAIRQTSRSGMLVDAADVDRDGDVDLVEIDRQGLDRQRPAAQEGVGASRSPGDYASRAHWQRNVLLLNRGDSTFAEVGQFAGIAASGPSQAAVFLDVDLDGYEDLLIGTGEVHAPEDGDPPVHVVSAVGGLDSRAERAPPQVRALPNVAFRNRGDLRFDNATSVWGFGATPDVSHSIALGDLDLDGDLDVVVGRLNAAPLLLRNNAPSARLAVRLVGRAPNTQAVGSVIRVRGQDMVEQAKEVSVGGLALSSSEPLYAFAAGRGDSLTIQVEWRGGGRTVVTDARPGRLYEIHEPATPAAPPAAAAANPTSDDALFEDVSAALEHRHVDPPFDDGQRQPLLPWKLSRLGPGVGWIDVDRDGDEDLFVGAGAGSQPTLFRNDRGRFRRFPVRGARDSFDLAGIAGWTDGRGAHLFIGQASYEARSPGAAPSEAAVLEYSVRRGVVRGRAVIPPDSGSAGPVALADYDHDGDLDLFVGGRVAPGAYPRPATSRLFRNESGRFTRDSANGAVLQDIGLVSSALFSDVDLDGDPDLVLAVEWGPLRLLVNDEGRFQDRTDSWGLARYSGRWNGVTSGDFDGDGRLDLVATNWGRNTPYAADSVTPLLAVFGEFERDGAMHLLLARRDDRLNAVTPLAPLARLTAALPSVRGRTPTFETYADASIATVLGDVASAASQVEARTLDHMVFLNRGGRFEGHALPPVAQLAPAFGVVVADFDGDGALDLFLAQNFSATQVGTPRFDAGRGLILIGDGQGRFRGLSGAQSGIRMPEDQRGAAVGDYNQDGRVDLVVGRNAAPVALFRNRAAIPGISVPIGAGLVGAILRLDTDAGLGPAQEVHAGSGYWSQNGRLVLTGPGIARAVLIRHRGNEERRALNGAGRSRPD